MRNSENGIVSIFNVLSIVGMVVIALIVAFSAYSGAKGDARDKQRVADFERISESLKNYYSDNNRYPDAVEGKPVGLEQYLERWPQSPEPADGICDKERNRYQYQVTNGGNAYAFGFCLGGKTGRYKAGVQVIKVP